MSTVIAIVGILIVFIVLSITLYALFFCFKVDGIGRLYFPKPRFSNKDIPSLTGKVAIVTGGTSGVGRVSAEQLLAKGARLVIITSRSQSSADKAANEIQRDYGLNVGDSKIIGKELALGDHKSIERFAEWFRSLNEPIHILMLNAGLGDMVKEPTSLGMERTVGCNWFGHFYLQHLLQDIVEQSAPSRIVLTASRGASMAPKLTDPLETYIKGDDAYGAQQYLISKLFNIYHAIELNRRIREKGINNVYVNAIHPGMVKTGLFDNLQGGGGGIIKAHYDLYKEVKEKKFNGGEFMVILALLSVFVGLNPSDGALTQLYAATSPEIEEKNISGEYIHPIGRRDADIRVGFQIQTPLPPQATDENLARKLWEYGESVIASIPKE